MSFSDRLRARAAQRGVQQAAPLQTHNQEEVHPENIAHQMEQNLAHAAPINQNAAAVYALNSAQYDQNLQSASWQLNTYLQNVPNLTQPQITHSENIIATTANQVIANAKNGLLGLAEPKIPTKDQMIEVVLNSIAQSEPVLYDLLKTQRLNAVLPSPPQAMPNHQRTLNNAGVQAPLLMNINTGLQGVRGMIRSSIPRNMANRDEYISLLQAYVAQLPLDANATLDDYIVTIYNNHHTNPQDHAAAFIMNLQNFANHRALQ